MRAFPFHRCRHVGQASRLPSWSLCLLLTAIGLAGAVCPTARAEEPSGGDPVLERCLVSLVEEAKVPAREPGVLIQLAVREGDVVKKGAVIAKIDDNQPKPTAK